MRRREAALMHTARSQGPTTTRMAIMGAAPAYAYPRPERVREQERPHLHVVPGSAPRTSVQTVSAAFLLAAKVIAVALVLVTAVGFARIALNSATVTTSLAAQEISSDLSEARSYAATLEVQQSTLSNPSRVKEAAADLGMGAPAQTATITLPVDVVATDEAGNVSLTESIRRAAEAAA